MLIFYNTVLNFLIIRFYDMQLHNMNDMQNKYRFGNDFNSSGVINGLCIIWRDWLGSFFPLLMEPDMTVLLPRLLDSTSADSEFGAKPPKMVS